MALAQPVRDDGERTLGIEHDEVGIAPGRDPSLTPEARELGRSRSAPAGEVSQVPAAVPRSSPGGGEPQLDRRDPAPCPHEVARVEAFELGWRGRMVARHQVERPVGEALDRKSTRLNSSHGYISYAVFCLKKKKEGRRGRCAANRLSRAE